MPAGRQVFVKRDLQARHAGQICDFALQVCRRMAVARAVWGEEHDAVAGTSRRIIELPLAFGVEANEGLDPAWTVEIGPLIGEAQMRLDDAAANGLEVQHAGVALEMLPAPCTAPFLDSGLGFARTSQQSNVPPPLATPAGVAPPLWLAVDQGDIAADVLAFEQGRPHMTGLVGGGVVVGRERGDGCRRPYPSGCRSAWRTPGNSAERRHAVQHRDPGSWRRQVCRKSSDARDSRASRRCPQWE